MVQVKEKSVIQTLDKILKHFGIPEAYYSLNGFADSSVCLEKSEEKWEVYIGDRQCKKDLKTISDLEEACVVFINIIADPKIKEEMRAAFKNALNNNN